MVDQSDDFDYEAAEKRQAEFVRVAKFQKLAAKYYDARDAERTAMTRRDEIQKELCRLHDELEAEGNTFCPEWSATLWGTKRKVPNA